MEKKDRMANITIDLAGIEKRIYTVRGKYVMIDLDLASYYGVENRSLRQTVRRNIDSFPADFLFKLTKREANELISNGVSQSVIPSGYNTGGAEMYAFTEQGVAMLATVLKSPFARQVSIAIMRAFVSMRHFFILNAQVFQRLDRLEDWQMDADQKFQRLFDKIEEKVITPKQGIFYDGQIYDAYEFICDIIRHATKRIVLIDNYVDDSVLTMLDKRGAGVEASIYTKELGNQFKLDVEKHNAQYAAIPVFVFRKSHDRFLIIDDSVYHIGASVKDLGKKWFAVSLMEAQDAGEIMLRLVADSSSLH